MTLSLTYAGGLYDRTQALRTGDVIPEGVRLTYLASTPEDVFLRMMQHQEFDCSEMSLASYSIAHERGEPDFVAIPVFPSRSFRLSCIYVRADSPLRSLEELRGKRVGMPEFQMTAAVWQRGILAEHYGVPVESVTWVTGRPERLAISLPPQIRVEHYQGQGGLAGALQAGAIDALMAARMPEEYARGRGLRRLLADSRAEEAAYFRKTGLFPIMHTVVIKGALYREHPWLARSLYDAFVAAKARTLAAMYDTTALTVSLPWLTEEIEATRRLLGDDYWSYGFSANRDCVATLLRYLYEQGLTQSLQSPEALFAPTLLET